MEPRATSPLAWATLVMLAAGCGGKDPGVDGSEIPIPYEALSGGIVFATGVIEGSRGYDLYWVQAPSSPTITPQPVVHLTRAGGNEWQPSVSRGGKGIVFVRQNDGVFLISTSGRVSRVTDTRGKNFQDSLPAVSFDGNKVAWVREDMSKPIGQTGFFETAIYIADFDGKNARPIAARAGIVQDSPVFEPSARATRIAWTEFDASSLTSLGPLTYGVYIHDLALSTGRYVCTNPEMRIENRIDIRQPPIYRCFGQHIDWVKTVSGDSNNPIEDHIVTGQELIDINVPRGTFDTLWPEVISAMQNQQLGQPDLTGGQNGFFPHFPLSINFSSDRFVLDGVIIPTDSTSEPTLTFIVSDYDGGGVWRLPVSGILSDYDSVSTAGFFFSVATPQFVP